MLRHPKLGDEFCTHSIYGTFNITALHELLNPFKSLIVRVPLNDGMVEHVRRNEISEANLTKLRGLPLEDLLSPGMVISEIVDGTTNRIYFIDGNHRALVLHERGEQEMQVYMLRAEMASSLRIDHDSGRFVLGLRDRNNQIDRIRC